MTLHIKLHIDMTEHISHDIVPLKSTPKLQFITNAGKTLL